MAKIAKNSVYKNPDGTAIKGSVLTPFGMHLTGALEDEYLTESMWIRCDDMDADTIAAYDALPEGDIQKLSLQYKLAKIKESADDKTFATDKQIDDLFGTCGTTTEPEPSVADYVLTVTNEANTENAAVYNALSALTFIEGEETTVDLITIKQSGVEDVECENCVVGNSEQADGKLRIDNRYDLYSDGKFVWNN